MKYLKISLMALVLGLFIVSDTTAQTDAAPADQQVAADRKEKREKKSPQERAKKQTEMMAKHLELTEEQKAKVEAINLKYATQGDIERAQRKALMAERDAEIKEVLTDEQIAKLDKTKKKMKEKRKGRKGGKRGMNKADENLQED